MKWIFTDGTVFMTPRNVIGGSSFATELRTDLEYLDDGGQVAVGAMPPPGGIENLELGDPWLVDQWLRTTAIRHRVDVVAAPEVRPWPDHRKPSLDHDENTVY